MIEFKKYRSIEWEPTCRQLNVYYGGKVEKKIKKKKKKARGNNEMFRMWF
tara:strand:+ start:123 stop:272 length:150 start_codon:yes stop_codon:yes gene_type:complete